MPYQKVTINRREIPDGAVESRWKAKDGWSIRRIDWPTTRQDVRGSMLFMPGRGDIYEKYLETLAHYQVAGWNVTSADWRGQGGSGRMTDNQYIGHISDFSIWLDDLADFWVHWKAQNPGPHVLMTHSMGGHLAGRALMEKRIDPVAAIFSAPMLGLHGAGMPAKVGHMVARMMSKIKGAKTPAWKVSEKPASPIAIRQKLLSHDNERYADELFWWGKRPELVMGPASWGWVERAYQSTRLANAPGQWEKIDCPALLLGTKVDQLVRYSAIADAAARIPGAELKSYGRESAHEILREVDAVRDDALATIDDFLERKAAK
jgi:lysophospholipase